MSDQPLSARERLRSAVAESFGTSVRGGYLKEKIIKGRNFLGASKFDWKTTYFILRAGTLQSFEDIRGQNMEQPTNVYNLSGATLTVKMSTYEMTLTFQDEQQLCLKTDSEYKINEWGPYLKYHIANSSSMQRLIKERREERNSQSHKKAKNTLVHSNEDIALSIGLDSVEQTVCGVTTSFTVLAPTLKNVSQTNNQANSDYWDDYLDAKLVLKGDSPENDIHADVTLEYNDDGESENVITGKYTVHSVGVWELHVTYHNHHTFGSPFPISVVAGPPEVSLCVTHSSVISTSSSMHERKDSLMKMLATRETVEALVARGIIPSNSTEKEREKDLTSEEMNSNSPQNVNDDTTAAKTFEVEDAALSPAHSNGSLWGGESLPGINMLASSQTSSTQTRIPTNNSPNGGLNKEEVISLVQQTATRTKATLDRRPGPWASLAELLAWLPPRRMIIEEQMLTPLLKSLEVESKNGSRGIGFSPWKHLLIAFSKRYFNVTKAASSTTVTTSISRDPQWDREEERLFCKLHENLELSGLPDPARSIICGAMNDYIEVQRQVMASSSTKRNVWAPGQSVGVQKTAPIGSDSTNNFRAPWQSPNPPPITVMDPRTKIGGRGSSSGIVDVTRWKNKKTTNSSEITETIATLSLKETFQISPSQKFDDNGMNIVVGRKGTEDNGQVSSNGNGGRRGSIGSTFTYDLTDNYINGQLPSDSLFASPIVTTLRGDEETKESSKHNDSKDDKKEMSIQARYGLERSNKIHPQAINELLQRLSHDSVTNADEKRVMEDENDMYNNPDQVPPPPLDNDVGKEEKLQEYVEYQEFSEYPKYQDDNYSEEQPSLQIMNTSDSNFDNYVDENVTEFSDAGQDFRENEVNTNKISLDGGSGSGSYAQVHLNSKKGYAKKEILDDDEVGREKGEGEGEGGGDFGDDGEEYDTSLRRGSYFGSFKQSKKVRLKDMNKSKSRADEMTLDDLHSSSNSYAKQHLLKSSKKQRREPTSKKRTNRCINKSGTLAAPKPKPGWKTAVHQHETFDETLEDNNETASVGSKVRLVSNGEIGIVAFCGPTSFSKNKKVIWYGIRLERAVGKNNGSINGINYFNAGQKRGLFVRRHAIELVMSSSNSARPWARKKRNKNGAPTNVLAGETLYQKDLQNIVNDPQNDQYVTSNSSSYNERTARSNKPRQPWIGVRSHLGKRSKLNSKKNISKAIISKEKLSLPDARLFNLLQDGLETVMQMQAASPAAGNSRRNAHKFNLTANLPPSTTNNSKEAKVANYNSINSKQSMVTPASQKNAPTLAPTLMSLSESGNYDNKESPTKSKLYGENGDKGEEEEAATKMALELLGPPPPPLVLNVSPSLPFPQQDKYFDDPFHPVLSEATSQKSPPPAPPQMTTPTPVPITTALPSPRVLKLLNRLKMGHIVNVSTLSPHLISLEKFSALPQEVLTTSGLSLRDQGAVMGATMAVRANIADASPPKTKKKEESKKERPKRPTRAPPRPSRAPPPKPPLHLG
jgi:hypothetical protein